MTRDQCVYTLRVADDADRELVTDYIHNSDTDEFSVTIVDSEMVDGAYEYTVEVIGDAYEIPVFEEGFAEFSSVEVVDGDVTIGV